MATNLTSGNDGYIADGGEIVNCLQGDDQIQIIHVDDSTPGNLDFDYFAPAEIYGNQGNDYIVSHEWADRMWGDSGDDLLWGGGGADTLEGGSGNDEIWTGKSAYMVDGNGNEIPTEGDYVSGGSGDDTVQLQHADNTDLILGDDGYDILHLHNGGGYINQFSLIAGGSNAGLVADGFEELHYYGGDLFETIEGGNHDDWIYGGGGTDLIGGLNGEDWLMGQDGSDVVNGGNGADWIDGGEGADSLRGDNGNDTIDGGIGNDTIYDGAGIDIAKGGAGNDKFHTGAGSDNISGGDGADVIREDVSDAYEIVIEGRTVRIAGGDTLKGDGGNDDIRGGTGNDQIFGGRGNDTLEGGADADHMDGGTDTDTATYAHASQGVTVALDGSLTATGDAVGDTFVSIERLVGSAHDDDMAGDALANTMKGGGGADALFGQSGGDSLFGEAGNDAILGGIGNDFINGGLDKDTLEGEAGNDTLVGAEDNDTLRGGTGSDRQIGGAGNDVHQGGSGFDTFVFFDDTEGNDRIDDWVAADDQIEIDASAFGGGLVAGALAANRLVVGAGPAANQAFGQFLYNTANGQLSWDVDGTGAAAAVNICRLLNSGGTVNTLAAGDFDIIA
jgi:Ca2+-binding RTX toxin-like protein